MEEVVQTSEVAQDQQIVYGGFWQRVVATLIDGGFSLVIIPVFVSIYYYFVDGQTLGYKVMGLQVRRSIDETQKPGGRRLLARRLFKIVFGVFIIAIIWLLVSLVFYVIAIVGAGSGVPNEDSLLNVIRALINRILGILTLIALLGGGLYWVTIPFSKKKKGIHDMITGTVVHKIGDKKLRWMILGLVMYVASILISLALNTVEISEVPF